MAAKGKNGNRDYKKEYAEYHGKPAQKKNRAQRNKAARSSGCGNGMDADHKTPMRKGGKTTKKNIRCVKSETNKGWRKGKKGYD